MNKLMLFMLLAITGINLHGMNNSWLAKYVGLRLRCDYSDLPLFFEIAYENGSYFLDFGGKKDRLDDDTDFINVCQMVTTKALKVFPWVFSWVKTEEAPFGKLEKISWQDTNGVTQQIWPEKPKNTKK